MLDLSLPANVHLKFSDSPVFVRLNDEHARHVLVDIRRIICAEELDGCLLRITLDCGNGLIKEIVVKEFVSKIERAIDKIMV